ncbi:hypothetical protein FJZ31_27370 [Candidatus Poribacteria bacterium]|nr:hypothetical protein [Candidatus Poribacteria bacterium]
MKKINLSGYFLRQGTASLCKIIAVMLVIWWFQIGCAKHAQFNKLVPAEIDIAGIQRVAVADFEGLEQSGKIVAAKIAEGIVDAGYYKLFEREKLSRIIEEREFSQSNVVDPTTVSQLKLVGVDALIFGVVDAYSIDEQTGVTKIEKKIGTGKYRTVEKEGKDGKVEKVQEEIKETVLVDRGYIIREGTIGVTFRMSNINTGQIVAVETETANFSKKAWQDEASELPSKDAILDDLSSLVVRRFLNKIQPRYVERAVEFESNKAPFTKVGIKYAQAGLWDKAEEAFKKAAEAAPADPKVHYNLAITYNVLSKHLEAIKALERAIELNPEKKYINTLAQFRQDVEEAEILDRQAGDNK